MVFAEEMATAIFSAADLTTTCNNCHTQWPSLSKFTIRQPQCCLCCGGALTSLNDSNTIHDKDMLSAAIASNQVNNSDSTTIKGNLTRWKGSPSFIGLFLSLGLPFPSQAHLSNANIQMRSQEIDESELSSPPPTLSVTQSSPSPSNPVEEEKELPVMKVDKMQDVSSPPIPVQKKGTDIVPISSPLTEEEDIPVVLPSKTNLETNKEVNPTPVAISNSISYTSKVARKRINPTEFIVQSMIAALPDLNFMIESD